MHRLPCAGHEDTETGLECGDDNGAPGTTRTYDPQLRKLMLYPTELRARWWFSYWKPEMGEVQSSKYGQGWRREWDSNPRYVAVHTLSKRAP